MRAKQLFDFLGFKFKQGKPVGIVSRPGVGKSSIVQQASKHFVPHNDFIVMNAANKDATDFSGLPTFTVHEDGVTKVVDWAKMRVLVRTKPVTLFLDELFQAPVAVQNVCAPIILEQRVDDIYLPEGSVVVFASNSAADKAGTNRVPSHLPNRATMVELDAHIDDWAEWCLARNDINVGVVQFVRMRSDLLIDFDPNRLINATPRQWAAVGNDVECGLPREMWMDAFAGQVGEGPAAECVGFLDIMGQLPSREEILLAPKSAPVPTDLSAVYAVAGMLAKASTANNFDAVATYTARLPEDFQAMLVKDAMRLCPAVMSTKAFTTWAVKFAPMFA